MSHYAFSLCRFLMDGGLLTNRISLLTMGHSPIRQTFEFRKSISTAGKSILNFIQLSSLVAKNCKMSKI